MNIIVLISLICWLAVGIFEIVVQTQGRECQWTAYWLCYLCLMLNIIARLYP